MKEHAKLWIGVQSVRFLSQRAIIVPSISVCSHWCIVLAHLYTQSIFKWYMWEIPKVVSLGLWKNNFFPIRKAWPNHIQIFNAYTWRWSHPHIHIELLFFRYCFDCRTQYQHMLCIWYVVPEGHCLFWIVHCLCSPDAILQIYQFDQIDAVSKNDWFQRRRNYYTK